MMSCQTSMPHNACYCTIHNEKAMSIDDTMKWTKKSPKENIISISLVVKKRVGRAGALVALQYFIFCLVNYNSLAFFL